MSTARAPRPRRRPRRSPPRRARRSPGRPRRAGPPGPSSSRWSERGEDQPAHLVVGEPGLHLLGQGVARPPAAPRPRRRSPTSSRAPAGTPPTPRTPPRWRRPAARRRRGRPSPCRTDARATSTPVGRRDQTRADAPSDQHERLVAVPRPQVLDGRPGVDELEERARVPRVDRPRDVHRVPHRGRPHRRSPRWSRRWLFCGLLALAVLPSAIDCVRPIAERRRTP